MKKLYFTLALLVIAFSAKSQAVEEGTVLLNASVGIIATGNMGLFYGSSSSVYPSIFLGGDYVAIPTGEIGLLSFGGEFGMQYASYSHDYHPYYYDPVTHTSFKDKETISYSFLATSFMTRVAWHLQGISSSSYNTEKWDAYAGLGIGVVSLTETVTKTYKEQVDKNDKDKTSLGSGMVYPFFVGMRMMVNDNFAIFGEFNTDGLSHMRAGISIKM